MVARSLLAVARSGSMVVLVASLGCAAQSQKDGTEASLDVDAAPAADAGLRPDAAPSLDDADPSTGFDAPDVTTVIDGDLDGYAREDDCDDANAQVNPGALELPGDGLDNDCDGVKDDAPAECDTGLSLASADALDFARSLGICRTTKPDAKGKERRWGVISATLETTDGKGAPMPRQYGVQPRWGSNVLPRAGGSLVALSTGAARTPDQPDYKAFPKGVDATSNVNEPPSGWPKNTKGCPASSRKTAQDSVVLHLVVRVPTNVDAFQFDFDFYTSEYVEYVCQAYNDTFVAILSSKAALPASADGNVSFTGDGDPVNVNSGFFGACSPDSWLGKSFDCPLGTRELVGTGFDATPSSLTSPARNGATGWLRTTAKVVAGEEIDLRFMIWNTGDHWLQSSVLLDAFRWEPAPVDATKTERPK